ncbi:MAG: patatin family protein [Coriobacteriales bacterium]|nr:patatin family protein [Coriobacteriales bacterium]
MARPSINLPVPLKRPTPFEVPEVYVPYTASGYQPAWSTATLVDANLVLEGGAMRGQFTAGVLDFLMDNGVMPKHVIGVSAGALNGFNYVAGSRGRTCYLNTKYCNDWRYLSMRSFAATGNAFNPDFSFDKIPNELDPFDYDSYRSSPLTLTTVASDLDLGEADYHQLVDPKREMVYLLASASMPLVSKIVEVDNKLLLDGGICDSIPLGHSQTLGETRHVVVLTQDATYEKGPNRLMPLIRRRYAAYPLFVERLEHRHFEYNRCYRQLAQLHEAGEIFVIRPPEPVAIASMEHDPEKLYNLWEQGYGEARRRFSALQRYLGLC